MGTDSIDNDINHISSLGGGTPARRYAWVAATIAVIVFGMLLLIRGPLTNPAPVGDFVHFYTAARAWTLGENPYDHQTLQRVVDEAPQAPRRSGERSQLIALYPPAMYPLMSPLAVLPYQTAALTWTVLNVALVPVLIILAAQLAEVRVRSMTCLLIAAGVLALAPLQTTFRLGQMSLVVTVLIVAALVLMRRHRQPWGGFMLGLALALKPQMGGIFLVYALARRRWWTASIALGTLLAWLVIAIAVLMAHGHDWWAGLRDNMHFFTHGGVGDPTPANPIAWQLINLQQLLHQFMANRVLVDVLVWSFVLALSLLGWRWATVKRSAERELLALALLAVLSLLVTYHRVYDAVLLAIPVAWLVRYGFEQRWAGWLTLALLLPFVISGPAALNQAVERGWVPDTLATSPIWHVAIMAHPTWALLGLAVVFVGLLAMRRRPAQQ